MRWSSGLFRYKIYRRVIGSLALITVLAVLAISIVLYALFAASATNEIGTNAQTMMERSAYSVNILQTQVVALANELANDTEIIGYLDSDQTDPLTDYRTVLRTDRIIAGKDFVASISLRNDKTGKVLSNPPLLPSSLTGQVLTTFFVVQPRKIPANTTKRIEERRLLSYLFSSNNSVYSGRAADIAIEINAEHIGKIVEALIGKEEDTDIIVLDKNGLILTSRQTNEFLADSSGEPWARTIASSQASSGYFTRPLPAPARFFAWAREPASGWVFVLSRPHSAMVGNLEKLRNITILVSLALIAVGMLISWAVSGLVYTPIGRMMERLGAKRPDSPRGRGGLDEFAILSDSLNRYDVMTAELREKLNSSVPFFRDTHAMALLQGTQDESMIPPGLYSEIMAYFLSYAFRVVVIQLEPSVREGAGPNFHALAANVAQRFGAEIPGLILADRMIAVVVRFLPHEDAACHERLFLTAVDLLQEMGSRISAGAAVGIGNVVFSPNELNQSYRSAVDYCRYRLVFGGGTVIDEEKVRDRSNIVSRYPSAQERRLIEALASADSKRLRQPVADFIDAVSGLSYYQIVTYCSQLLLAVFKQFENATDLQDENFQDYAHLVRKVETAGSLDDLSNQILEFCTGIMAIIHRRQSQAHVLRNRKTVEEAKRLLHSEYANPGLSIDMVANAVNLSPGYLNKLFKLAEGVSISDYLSTIRLEKAKELMSASAAPIADICSRVGIYNITYFSTLFKKVYGVSPSIWRHTANQGQDPR